MAILRVPASPDALALSRAFIRQQMLAADMNGRTEDAIVAVNEAVTNVVRHAYVGSAGEVEIVFEPTPAGVTVTVRDHGRGPGTWRDTAGAGFGSAIMAKLSDSLDIHGKAGAGTEVSLRFNR
jgi:anti-sigma regulatory factor (Ser/Thr protein kinase)